MTLDLPIPTSATRVRKLYGMTQERKLVWLITLAGIAAVVFGVFIFTSKLQLRLTGVRVTGTVAKPAVGSRRTLQYEVNGRRITIPIWSDSRKGPRARYEYLGAGSTVALLVDPTSPERHEVVSDNTAGILAGLAFLVLGLAFALIGRASLRYLRKLEQK